MLGCLSSLYNFSQPYGIILNLSIKKIKNIYVNLIIKIPNFLCGHRKDHSPFSTQIGSVYTLFCVVTSAHTLLGQFILMLRLVEHTLCLDQLYSVTDIMLSSLCTPVQHFVITSAHTLLGQF